MCAIAIEKGLEGIFGINLCHFHPDELCDDLQVFFSTDACIDVAETISSKVLKLTTKITINFER